MPCPIAVDPHTEKTRRCHVDRSGEIPFYCIILMVLSNSLRNFVARLSFAMRDSWGFFNPHLSVSLLKIVNEYPILAVIVVLAERPKSSVFELWKISERP